MILSGASLPGRLLLANPLMTWIGRLSYSLYLVHWPLIVLYRYVTGPHLELRDQALLAAASLLLAVALNRAVELRFRLAPGDRVTRSGMAARRALAATGMAALLVTGLALAGVISKGWPGRMPEGVRLLAATDLGISADQKQVLARHCAGRSGVFCGARRVGEPTSCCWRIPAPMTC